MRTPLAWQNLTSNPKKCLLAATGVGFAVLLMFMQIGFRGALIDSNVQLLSLFDTTVGNISVYSRARYNLSTEQRFPRELLRQIDSLPEVEGTFAIALERGSASVQVEGFQKRPIRVVGVEIDKPEFLRDPGLADKLHQAAVHEASLVDVESKPAFGFASSEKTLSTQNVELNQKRLPVLGQFRLGTDFGNEGTLLMSERVLADYFPWRGAPETPLEAIDIGLVRVTSTGPKNLEQVAKRIQQLAPNQILAQPTEQMVQREKVFWAQATPIGKIFFIGTVMGFIVGAIICYQIQFTDITEQMSEFATLKAMGYRPAYFWSLILWQSFYLACFGFLPGLLGAIFLYELLGAASGLSLQMTVGRAAVVFALTLAMCIVSGALAIRKLFGSDPASLF